MRTVVLAGPVDWPGFAHAVRALVAERVAPDALRWCDRAVAQESIGLFDDGPSQAAVDLPAAPTLRLPASFVERAKLAALHADATRFALLYRLVWRLQQDRRVALDPLDADWLRLERLAHAVRREIHKTHAFVRFRPVRLAQPAAASADDDADGLDAGVRHVAWFEPEHHIIEAAAPFFVRRFAQLHWAILTPRVSVAWDRRVLRIAAGASRGDAPAADAGEALWLAYYASIFNPARVKEAMMRKEMPVRYWTNLPEARLIAPLLATASGRTQRMIDAAQAGDGDGDDGGGSDARERPRRRATAVKAAARRDPDAAPADRSGSDAVLATPGDDDGSPPDPAGSNAAPPPLDALARRAAHCRACPIGAHATQTVWGDGAPNARLLLVGEQPGDREDLSGQPFVGPAGRLLRRAFAQLGWPAERLYLTNAVKHFKFELRGKRRIHKTANQREIEICSGWLEAEIAAVRPEALVALGATAARSLLGRAVPIGRNEGEWLHERADGRPVLVVAHPAALLRMVDGDSEAAYQRWVGLLARAGRYVDAAPEPARPEA